MLRRSHRSDPVTRCALAVLACVVPLLTLAGSVYVDITNDTGVEDGTPANPYNTVQEGIDNALQGDRVLVAPGLYKETVAMSDGVSVLGENAVTTILDGTGMTNSVVTFDGTRLSPVLSGFTILGGEGDFRGEVGGIPVFVGGGIRIVASSPVITQNVITGNRLETGYGLGAGIYVYSNASTPLILENVISDNVALSSTVPDAGQGGGVYVVAKNGGLVLEGNRIENNDAFEGGALFVENVSTATIEIRGNVLSFNEASAGGALFLTEGDDSTTLFVNNLVLGNQGLGAGDRGAGIAATAVGTGSFEVAHNTFVGNTAPTGTGGALWLDSLVSTGTHVVANNVFDGNSAAQGGGIEHTLYFGEIRTNDFHDNAGGDLHDGGGSGAVLSGNLFLDPGFIAPELQNYRLGPGSPCIDAADPAYAELDDLDRFYRPFDGDSDSTAIGDIGAYEFPGGELAGLRFLNGASLDVDPLPVQDEFNLYRGSLPRLLATGEYTQDPAVEPLAARFCGLLQADLPYDDGFGPAAGETVFYLMTAVIGDWEGPLGTASSGLPRPNDRACP